MFDELIRKYSGLYQIPEAWIRATIETESSYRSEVVSADGGYGLMQVTEPTARGLGFAGNMSQMLDPDTNLRYGVALLSQLRARLGDNLSQIYSAYNSGSPTAYLDNNQVAANVARFLVNLQAAIEEDPFIAASGALGVALIALLWWAWSRGKK